MNVSVLKINVAAKVIAAFALLVGSMFLVSHLAAAITVPTYTIEGYKYQCYEDGDYYCNDGLEGWTIYAQNGDGKPLETTTNDDGYFSFVVTAGTWVISEQDQDNWEQVEVKENGEIIESSTCSFEIVDMEEPPLEVLDIIINTAEAEVSMYLCEFGNVYTPTFPVVGTKWNDANANGLKDEGENGIGGWTIIANDGDGRLVEVETEDNGEYTLDLEAGFWTISEEARSGWDQIAVEQNGEAIEGTTCTFEIGYEYSKSVERKILDEEYTPSCSFFNDRERSSGSSSGTRVSDRPTPTVLGVATGTPACGMYLTEYMRMDSQASSSEVLKLQIFLNAVGIEVEMNGIFDAATDAAVRSFQATHKADVLTPWLMAKLVPHENPTGWVYQLTRWKINNMVCPGSEAYPVLN